MKLSNQQVEAIASKVSKALKSSYDAKMKEYNKKRDDLINKLMKKHPILVELKNKTKKNYNGNIVDNFIVEKYS